MPGLIEIIFAAKNHHPDFAIKINIHIISGITPHSQKHVQSAMRQKIASAEHRYALDEFYIRQVLNKSLIYSWGIYD